MRKRGGGEDKQPRPSRSERTADKRERILKAAIKVFARKGFYAARVSEIAKAAGVADGTIYLYFRNKDDVLISVFESRITRLVEVLQEIVGSGGSFEERFARMVELQLGVLEGRRDLAEVVTVNLRQSSKLLKQFAAPFFVQYLEVMAGLIAQAQRDGAVRADLSPRLVARSLWGALDGIALTWAIGGGEAGQLARAAPQVASLFLEGLKARRDLRAIPRASSGQGGSDDA
jgi:TetR/AcrR family fatty acid metabolism transcriptional regulator